MSTAELRTIDGSEPRTPAPVSREPATGRDWMNLGNTLGWDIDGAPKPDKCAFTLASGDRTFLSNEMRCDIMDAVNGSR